MWAHTQEGRALTPWAGCVCMCVLLWAVLSNGRKLIVWVLVNDPQEKETQSVKQVAQNKSTPLSCGHTELCTSVLQSWETKSSTGSQLLTNSFTVIPLKSVRETVAFVFIKRKENFRKSMDFCCVCGKNQGWKHLGDIIIVASLLKITKKKSLEKSKLFFSLVFL